MRITYELGHKGSKQYDTDNRNDMPVNNIYKAINKLGQLEDIEEELGIDLITLYKALKNGIYFYGQKEEEPQDVQLRMFHEEPMLIYNCEDLTELEVYVAGYGLSWDLVKMSANEEKELENE